MASEEAYKWYVLRTSLRSEKKVKDLLDIAGIKNYIPFYKSFRSWNGIEKELELPVFPNFAFVYVNAFDFEMLKFMEEISFFVDKQGNPFYFTDEQMEMIKNDPSCFKNELFKTI